MAKNDGRRVLITGAGGFLGACAAHHFEAEGWEVFAGVRKTGANWRLAKCGAKQIELDITNAAGCKGALASTKPDVIINYAAYGAYPAREKDATRMRQVNVDGIANLLLAARGMGVKKFVQIGSSSEYGPKNAPMRESDICTPDTPYGKTKLEATKLVLAANSDGLETAVIRPFSPFGEWEDKERLVPTLLVAALKGKAAGLSSPNSKRDFMYVGNFNEGVALAAQNEEAAGEIFNISSGNEMSVGEIAGIVGKLLPSAPAPKWGSAENPRNEPSRWEANISKARKILGWKPQVGVEEGLEITGNWIATHLENY